MRKYGMYINGQEAEGSSGEWMDSVNPFTGQAWAKIARGTAADAERAIHAAHSAFTTGAWPELNASQRGVLLHRLGDLIARDSKNLAELEVLGNGKLIAEMQTQLNYVPNWFYYFAGLADKVQGANIPIDKKGYLNYTKHEPLGVVSAITPWNSPIMIAAMKLAPALAAGNTVVLKPSEFTSASTLDFVKLFQEAGFPPGVVNVVTGLPQEVGTTLVTHPLVRKVAFTGSDHGGRQINELAAKSFKRVTLELGGKSPNIVFDDANLQEAVDGALSGILAATGQTCIAGSRLLLQEGIYDRFMEKFLSAAKTARMGDPMNMETQIGPVATRPQFDKVLGYIEIAKQQGAKVLLGGGASTRQECGKGWFVEPTVLAGVTNDMRIAQEEVFGPVLAVIRFKDEQEAISIANDTRYGLGAGVWTADMGRALRMSERIQAGTVWVNTYRAISYLSPFGGYKDSGLGRENGIEAIYEYLQTKSVWINAGAPTVNPYVMRL